MASTPSPIGRQSSPWWRPDPQRPCRRRGSAQASRSTFVMASPARHSSTPWRRRYWQRRQSHDVAAPRHNGVGDGSTNRRRVDPEMNLIEDSNTHPIIIIRYSTFLLDSFFPARFSNSRDSCDSCDWNLNSMPRSLPEIADSSLDHTWHPRPTDCDPFRQHSSRRARPNARPPHSRQLTAFPSFSSSRSPRAKKGAIARCAAPGLLSVPKPICGSHWALQ